MEYLFFATVLFLGIACLWAVHERTERRIAQKGYHYYIKFSRRWKLKAYRCKRRFGFRCALCNSPFNLNAHHRTYRHLFHEKQEDLTCLCQRCHEIFSAQGKLYRT